MKLTVFIQHTNPLRVEEVKMEDVSEFRFTENGLEISFNQSPPELIPFRANDGQGEIDWTFVSLAATRVGLKIDMSS